MIRIIVGIYIIYRLTQPDAVDAMQPLVWSLCAMVGIYAICTGVADTL